MAGFHPRFCNRSAQHGRPLSLSQGYYRSFFMNDTEKLFHNSCKGQRRMANVEPSFGVNNVHQTPPPRATRVWPHLPVLSTSSCGQSPAGLRPSLSSTIPSTTDLDRRLLPVLLQLLTSEVGHRSRTDTELALNKILRFEQSLCYQD